MRTSKIKALIKLVENSGVDELEVSSWGKKVRIRKRISSNGNNSSCNPQVVQSVPDRVNETVADRQAEVKAETPPPREENLLEIKSPMVGTFYRAPAPDAKPYVEVGEKVTRGQTICIIEAMKIMNEIESEYDGRVVEVPLSNAQPVQFGQPLVIIEPA
ncbi:MAG: acetyl-CoA carboxylase biotin carboxyl carrier protein [candidate division Zixibacteria bacterium]|nr:acetyl-CoA carboxylase biotin carboxyl carrier protein [candidate division Zixibacteria bacterium]